jgi:UDP-N-acetylmuramoyl-tripeptide--D-alanyl-D-alanine ligase
MISFLLSETTRRLGGRLEGVDVRYSAVGTDSRSIPSGGLFVALRGERFDGHEFVPAAVVQGAAAAVVERQLAVACSQIVVDDSHRALGRIGAMWRDASDARFVALTGSNGKTTLKEMIAAILEQRGSVLATHGNLNNDIGVPLTLTGIQDEEFAVVEMGANHAGEIDYLSRLTRPDVAVINNAGRAHLEGFGSIEGVARGKGEIVNGLGPDGIFVFPGDAAWTPLWRELAGTRRIVTFGTGDGTDITAAAEESLVWNDTGFVQEFAVRVPGGELPVQLALAGLHNRRNALAAIATAHALGIDLEAIAIGLAGMEPVPGRLCPVPSRNGLRIIDDSYNANPDSVGAAVRVLASAPAKRVLVLGDLAELGADSDAMHAELGALARAQGIDRLYTLGNTSRLASDAFGAGSRHFSELGGLVDHLRTTLGSCDTVLVKGSRSARMERVVTALCDGEERLAC